MYHICDMIYIYNNLIMYYINLYNLYHYTLYIIPLYFIHYTFIPLYIIYTIIILDLIKSAMVSIIIYF